MTPQRPVRHDAPARRGTILIIVAGISALLASLALAFIARMQTDVQESRLLLQHAQAKIMLAAACNYVQESSRLGWDRWYADDSSVVAGLRPDLGSRKIHEEAFGWVDVRDGSIGPKNRNGTPLFSGTTKWPALYTHARCPMYVMEIPPYATRLDATYNAMARTKGDPDYCWPLLRYPDPQPVVKNKWTHADPNGVDASAYPQFEAGDPRPRPGSTGRSWFRVYRDGPSTFLLTCGSGATDGFKSWTEVQDEGMELLFNDDPRYFQSLQHDELRLWYRIEWSATVLETSYHNLHHEIAANHEHYESWPPNSSHTWSSSRRTQTWVRNPVGSIRWIQRLMHEPTNW